MAETIADRETIAAAIVKFAEEHKLLLHPGQDSFKWADLVIKKGGVCPCVPGRNHCPCEFVLEDIKEINRCRCGLFVDSTYISEFNRLTQRKREKGKGKWTQKPEASS